MPDSKKPKTTIRAEDELHEIIHLFAESNGASVNALVLVSWNRIAEMVKKHRSLAILDWEACGDRDLLLELVREARQIDEERRARRRSQTDDSGPI